MALVQRLLSFVFVLGEGTFGEDGSNTVTLSGLRAAVRVSNAGGRSMGTLQADIYGMTLSQMNKLSTLGLIVTTTRRNSITVLAGDATNGMSVVFQGTINNSWADIQESPEVAFHVEAQAILLQAVAPALPTSYNGPVDVATVLAGLAVQMGLQFVNNGASRILSFPYYAGSPRVQAQAAVDHAGIEWNGGTNGVLEIWNPGVFRSAPPLVVAPPPAGGLIGYPAFTSRGIVFRTLYTPSLSLATKVNVQSSLQPAAGIWAVFALDYALDTMMPNGKWEAVAQACPVGLGPIVPSTVY